MNVLVTSLSLILIGVTMIHPAFFWAIDRQVRRNFVSQKYLRTNYIIHISAALISVILYWLYRVNYPLQIAGLVYLGVIIVVVLFYWNAELTKWNLFTASVFFGFIVFYRSVNEIVEITPLWPGLMTGILSASALSILIYLLTDTQNNQFDGDTNRIRKGFYNLLYLIIGIRIAWQIVILFNLSVATQYGDTISAITFFWQISSTRLILIILLGMVVPLIFLIGLRKVLLRSELKYRLITTSVLFISIFIAEILNKYFLLQFGIVL